MEEMEVYTIPEVAKMLRVNQTTVSRLIHRGRIRAYKIGKIYRISKEEVDRFLSNSISEPEIRKRISLRGITNGNDLTDKDFEEAKKIWEMPESR